MLKEISSSEALFSYYKSRACLVSFYIIIYIEKNVLVGRQKRFLNKKGKQGKKGFSEENNMTWS